MRVVMQSMPTMNLPARPLASLLSNTAKAFMLARKAET